MKKLEAPTRAATDQMSLLDEKQEMKDSTK